MPTYVITGARGGIGLEYVTQLSRDPANTVVALVRSASPSADLSSLAAVKAASKATTHILECDIASEASIRALPGVLSAALGHSARVDVLINNAATLQYASQTSLTLDAAAVEAHMTTNVLGPARMLQALLPFLTAGGDGEGLAVAVVANITSGAGSLGCISEGRVKPVLAGYSISKAALNMLTVHQAKELKNKGVVVVAVDPGHVKTASGGRARLSRLRIVLEACSVCWLG
ncbi:short chain dehydrogenase/reductase SDR [Colletotrichum tofieldiae]|nr:short chain dehydrogenase/reductase SDR [Colletotrichum tofieldiae]